MGNALGGPPFIRRNSRSAKLIFWEGHTRAVIGRRVVAGEIMFEFPDRMVCHADSFFLGSPVPALSIADHLVPGETYFVLPIDACGRSGAALSASSFAALRRSPSSGKKGGSPIDFGDCPFEYVKDKSGTVVIKVLPEFIARLIGSRDDEGGRVESASAAPKAPQPPPGYLCSTPELKKHYDQLVGSSKVQVWSPKLEPISEYQIRSSAPCRLLRLELWNKKSR